MLGLSDPRFARRVLLFDKAEKCLGFSNLRRIRRMSSQLKNSELLEKVDVVSSIADSVFRIPEHFPKSDWHILSVTQDLLKHYGERFHLNGEEEKFHGSPFMKHVDIVGGGLCAQACCFMATALVYNWARRIVSIPEISFLAADHDGGNFELRLTGLNEYETQRYFQSSTIGLNATLQRGNSARNTIPTVNDWKYLFHTLKAYLGSGCPVLSLVDKGRMGGNSGFCDTPAIPVYDPGKSPFQETGPEVKNSRHMIILIGYEKHGENIVCNDPAFNPFVTMHVSALISNACYQVPSAKMKFKLGERLVEPVIIPITASQVRLPLLGSQYPAQTGKIVREGLFHILSFFEPEDHFNGRAGSIFPKFLSSGFILTQIANLIDRRISKMPYEGIDDEVLTALSEQGVFLLKRGWPEQQWLWVQTGAEFILLWNAEEDPALWDDTRLNYKEFLVSVGAKANGNNGFTWSDGEAKGRPSNSDPGHGKVATEIVLQESECVSPGVITSFSSEGISGANDCLGNRMKNLALQPYCFMVNDSRTFMGSFLPLKLGTLRDLFFDGDKGGFRSLNLWGFKPRLEQTSNVCRWLASKSKSLRYARQVARRIHTVTKDSRGCCAISTYLPGITSDDKEKYDEALKATHCILRIAEAYNKISENKIRVVEMVGGNLISKQKLISLPRADKTGQFAAASVLCKEEATRRILDALEKLVKDIPDDISIALELEPGPLAIVSGWDDFVRVAKDIKARHTLKNRVGFNCNVANWSLGDISLQDINNDLHKTSPQVAAHILHAHVSDFGKGHLGDLDPMAVNDKTFFIAWLHNICRAYTAAKENGLNPSGHVSLELELPESREILCSAIHKISSLCNEIQTRKI